ncbi:hypothetical protein [Taibaiella soli]|nr:hypothetical protein [Taibaiella soli]
MKKLFLTLSVSILFTQITSAQQWRPSYKDSLQKASDGMYDKGSAYFIIVDAFKDGILKPGTPFEFSYEDSIVRFSDAKLSEKMQQEYAAKFRAFLIEQYEPANIKASWRSDSVSTMQIFDTNSRLWGPTMKENRELMGTHAK